jgi:hypothetical protein
MKNILIIGSIYEGPFSTKYKRVTSMAKPFVSSLSEYLIDYTFFLREASNMDAVQRLKGEKAYNVGNFTSVINNFNPDFILLHTGIVYWAIPEYVNTVIHDLKDQFRPIEFGIEDRSQIGLFENNTFSDLPEVIELEKIIFNQQKGRNHDHFRTLSPLSLAKQEIELWDVENSFCAEVAEGSYEFILDSLNMALVQLPEIFSHMRDLLYNDSFFEAAVVAHKLKPYLGFWGFMQFQALVYEFENNGKCGRLQELKESFPNLEYLQGLMIINLKSEYERIKLKYEGLS